MAVVFKRSGSKADGSKAKVRKPYTVRWTANGKQSEKSFPTLRDANDFKASVENAVRQGSYSDPQLSRVPFRDYAAQVVGGMDVAEGTAGLYAGVMRAWVDPWAGTRTLAQVCGDRESLSELINVSMVSLSYDRRGIARAIVTATADEAVAAGRLSSHRLAGIRMKRDSADVTGPDRSFVFPSKPELEKLAGAMNGCGLAVWLMRGCGLRIGEALAVHREDFSDDGTSLRVCGQASADGSRKVALKGRKPGEYRDVPVPGYLWDLVESLPAGPVVPGKPGTRYQTYNTVAKRFEAARKALRLPAGFTPHSLRHAFVSALLGRGVPITDVAQWLGHRSISVTYGVYGHLVPSAAGRAREALDSEFESLT